MADRFAPRFFPQETAVGSEQTPGQALLEFILSHPDSMSLMKPPENILRREDDKVGS